MRIFLILIALSLMGCAGNKGPYVSLDALASGKQKGRSYVLLPGNPQQKNADQLYYEQVESYVNKVLEDDGYHRVQDKNTADQAIFIFYTHDGGVSNTHNEVVPIWGQTGVSSSTTYGTVTPLYGGGGIVSANTTYTPTYGITGAYNQTVTDTFYSTSIRLESFDVSELKQGRDQSLWRVTATSTGKEYNDRRDVKMLIYFSMPYIGKNLPERLSGYAGGDTKKMDAYFN